jgi:hypothetical protein
MMTVCDADILIRAAPIPDRMQGQKGRGAALLQQALKTMPP